MDDAGLPKVARPQHPHLRLRRDATIRYGVTSRRAAGELGVAASTYHDWCDVEDVRQLHRGVVALPDVDPSPEQRVAAALLAAGPVAVAGFDTAAFLHRFASDLPDPITVLVPAATRARTLDDVEVVRTRHLDATDRTTVRRLACTTVERTLVAGPPSR